MESGFIPKRKPESFPTKTKSSNKSVPKPSTFAGLCSPGFRYPPHCFYPGVCEPVVEQCPGPTAANTPPPALPPQRGSTIIFPHWGEQPLFNVLPSAFKLWRVIGAWWSSRSSKPLSPGLPGRGRFDSFPLRQYDNRGKL